MKIHYIQHVSFEDLAAIEPWLKAKGCSISSTKLYDNEPLPEPQDFDCLIIMGGPMNIYEESAYPWLAEEKKLIELAIKKDKYILGICLGAQLIADVLGAKVYKNKHPEIGWYRIYKTAEANNSARMNDFPISCMAFHWHGDTFDIPHGATHIAYSKECKNQAFIYGKKILGMQFHFESSVSSIQQLITNCESELEKRKFIQSKEEILKDIKNKVVDINKTLGLVLSKFLGL